MIKDCIKVARVYKYKLNLMHYNEKTCIFGGLTYSFSLPNSESAKIYNLLPQTVLFTKWRYKLGVRTSDYFLPLRPAQVLFCSGVSSFVFSFSSGFAVFFVNFRSIGALGLPNSSVSFFGSRYGLALMAWLSLPSFVFAWFFTTACRGLLSVINLLLLLLLLLFFPPQHCQNRS